MLLTAAKDTTFSAEKADIQLQQHSVHALYCI